MKTLKAVSPFLYSKGINYKIHVYNAWLANGGNSAKSHYLSFLFHHLLFACELPSIIKFNKYFYNKEARLRFVDPLSLNFESFPDYILYEIVPMIWDCWPMFYEKMFKWFITHKIKTAIFSSSQTADIFKERFPKLNIIWCPEAIECSLYNEGKKLTQRKIDLLEFGRPSNFNKQIDKIPIRYLATKINGRFLYSDDELRSFLSDSKISITYPRAITQPDVAAGVETLTQRYWECMASRTIMVGHAPEELIKLIGYNPVIEIPYNDINCYNKIIEILNNIEDYQDLVDKNREAALIMGDWRLRMRDIQNELKDIGYIVHESIENI